MANLNGRPRTFWNHVPCVTRRLSGMGRDRMGCGWVGIHLGAPYLGRGRVRGSIRGGKTAVVQARLHPVLLDFITTTGGARSWGVWGGWYPPSKHRPDHDTPPQDVTTSGPAERVARQLLHACDRHSNTAQPSHPQAPGPCKPSVAQKTEIDVVCLVTHTNGPGTLLVGGGGGQGGAADH